MDCMYIYTYANIDRSPGDLESPIVSHQMSLDILEIMDKARKEMGVVYPADKA